MQEMWAWLLGRENCPGNGNPLQYSCLKNSMDRGPGGLQSIGSQRLGHERQTGHTHMSSILCFFLFSESPSFCFQNFSSEFIVWLWVPLKNLPAATTAKLSPFSFVRLCFPTLGLLHKFGLKTSHYIFFPRHVPSQMSFQNVSSSLHLKQHSGFCSNHSKKSSWTSPILKWLFLLWKSVLFQWLVS